MPVALTQSSGAAARRRSSHRLNLSSPALANPPLLLVGGALDPEYVVGLVDRALAFADHYRRMAARLRQQRDALITQLGRVPQYDLRRCEGYEGHACGREFRPRSGAQKRCEPCARAVKLAHNRASVDRYRKAQKDKAPIAVVATATAITLLVQSAVAGAQAYADTVGYVVVVRQADGRALGTLVTSITEWQCDQAPRQPAEPLVNPMFIDVGDTAHPGRVCRYTLTAFLNTLSPGKNYRTFVASLSAADNGVIVGNERFVEGTPVFELTGQYSAPPSPTNGRIEGVPQP